MANQSTSFSSYQYNVSTVPEWIDLCQKLTRWGEVSNFFQVSFTWVQLPVAALDWRPRALAPCCPPLNIYQLLVAIRNSPLTYTSLFHLDRAVFMDSLIAWKVVLLARCSSSQLRLRLASR